MSRILKSKKRFVLGVVASLAIAAVAFAYWTTSGDGDGSATAGTDKGVTVSGDPGNDIFPGSNVAVDTVIDNDSADQPQYVTNLHVAISTSDAGCDPDWFTYAADADDGSNPASNPHTSPVGVDIAADGDHTVPGKVFMSNPNENQDDCKNATLTLDYQANNEASYTP